LDDESTVIWPYKPAQAVWVIKEVNGSNMTIEFPKQCPPKLGEAFYPYYLYLTKHSTDAYTYFLPYNIWIKNNYYDEIGSVVEIYSNNTAAISIDEKHSCYKHIIPECSLYIAPDAAGKRYSSN
jgi:hypothetical protein